MLSAYTLVGQSANIPKSHLHCMSRVRAFLVAWRTRWSRGVPRHLNCLLSLKQGPCLIGGGRALKRGEVCCPSR
jgi:hypothetical protein